MTSPPPPGSDRLSRFVLESAGVRGVHVRLDGSWAEIAARAEYPPAVAELLGEAVAAAALMTAHAKIDGRLSLQLRGEGALRLLFAECTAAGTVRGIAQLDESVPAAGFARDLRGLGDGAVLAITIENHALVGRDPQRYQGLVPLESDSLAGALEAYFRQSEQLPTRIVLATDGTRLAGMMLQRLPGEGGAGHEPDDVEGWERAGVLLDTLGADELLALPVEDLLHRLFHGERVRLHAPRDLRFACSCSRERVAEVLQSIGEEEALAAAEQGVAEIRCEFCGERYHFDADAIAALFAGVAGVLPPPPDRLQ